MTSGWKLSILPVLLAAPLPGCAQSDLGNQRSVALAVWEFMETLPDTVCNACDTLFIHPLIVTGYDGSVRSYQGSGSTIALPYAVGAHRQTAGKVFEVTPLEQLDSGTGQVALAARLRGEATDSLRERLEVVVEIYVRRDGQWLLEGAAVGAGSRSTDGWRFQLKELNWT